ncbi:MAG: hypothetical protein HRT51_19580 [Colwellia sp.]|nr:hypothetical protein [Colwellia sp.]
MEEISSLLVKFKSAATEIGFSSRTGINALKTYLAIKAEGLFEIYSKENPNSYISKSTFNKHKRIALRAGIALSDFETTNTVTQLPVKPMEMTPVNSWDELKYLSKM